MGLFSRKDKGSPAQSLGHLPSTSASGSTSTSTSTSTSRNLPWLRRTLGNKSEDSNLGSTRNDGLADRHSFIGDPFQSAAPGSSSPPTDQDSPRAQSLWDAAYDTLKKDDLRLVEEYEDLLSKEVEKKDADADSGSVRQAQLNAIIVQGLQRMEEKGTKFTIAGHEFSLSEQISQAARLVLWAKEWVGQATSASPEASIAWAGVCLVLPLLTNPKIAEEANRDGFVYVTTRMRYYAELEPLMRRLAENTGVREGLVAEVDGHITVLYRYILEFQIRSVLRFYQSSLRVYAKDMVLSRDWKQMRLNIEQREATVNANLAQVNELVSRQELESLNKTSAESLQSMEKLLSTSEQQLRVAEEHRDIAQKQLEIQERAAEQQLSRKEAACLQLFRLTSNEKDATYEWYKDRVETRVEGTCEWFVTHDSFRHWLAQESGPLLVSADPGCGKSVLAKYLIDCVLPRSATVCYFFFKDQDQCSTRQALCALLHQLFSQMPFLIKHALGPYERDGEKLIKSSNSLWRILEIAVRDLRAGSVILVLDALDECDESDFKDLVRKVKNQFCSDDQPGRLKYLLTSRPYEQIVSSFGDLSDYFPFIRIPGEDESERIGQEVNLVIHSRVEELARQKRLTEKVKNHLADQLLGIPHRTYLWVYLVFNYLVTEGFKKTVKGIEAAIKTLPTTLNQAYEQILRKSKGPPAELRKALSIILAAARPLTLGEMNVAMEINAEMESLKELDLEDDKDFGARLRAWCGLFLSIHQGKIYFLHQTAREFLHSESIPTTVAIPGELRWQNSVTDREAHATLAEVCIRYLRCFNFDVRSDPYSESSRDADIIMKVNLRKAYYDDYILLHYADWHWAEHFCDACFESDDERLVPLAWSLCDAGSNSGLSWFGICRMILDATPIQWASRSGYKTIVHLLLDRGADIESKDEHKRTPLFLAVSMDKKEAIQVLLDRGADIEARDDEGQTPLFKAVSMGKKEAIQVLLDRGADIEARDNEGQTPLFKADNKEVIQVLLDRVADIEAKDNKGQKPLFEAVSMDRKEAIQILLDKGADIKAKDDEGQTPLFKANDKEVIQVLLDRGADIEAKDNYGWSPLFLAVSMDRKEIIQVLLDRGADIEAKDNFGWSPLFLAVSMGRNEAIQVLLDRGADIKLKDNNGDIPWLLRRKIEHEKGGLVQLLLERGIEFRTESPADTDNSYEV